MTVRSRGLRSIAGLAGALALLCLGPGGPAAADALFGPMAGEILNGIRSADVSQVPASSGYGPPTIAVRAFVENDLPIPGDIANAWNRRLLAEMQRQARGQFTFVDRAAFPSLIREIERSSRSAEEKAERIADLKESTRADILVSGAITLPGDTPVLAYQAVGVPNGRLLASTAPRRMPYPEPAAPPPARVTAAAAALPVATGITQPAGYRQTIHEAERLLSSLGYDPGPVDGILTRETRDALSAYQADSALPVTGRMTRRTVENMRRDRR